MCARLGQVHGPQPDQPCAVVDCSAILTENTERYLVRDVVREQMGLVCARCRSRAERATSMVVITP